MTILQARILEWVATSSSKGLSEPRSPALQADSLLSEPPGMNTGVGNPSLLQQIFLNPGIRSGSHALQVDSLPVASREAWTFCRHRQLKEPTSGKPCNVIKSTS